MKKVIISVFLMNIFLVAVFAATWEKRYYVDDFGDYTDIVYLTTKYRQSGTFTDSVSTNETLVWYLLIDKDSVCIKLFENGYYSVSGYDDKYTLTVRDDKNNDTVFSATSVGDRLEISNKTQFINLLKTNSNPRIVIK